MVTSAHPRIVQRANSHALRTLTLLLPLLTVTACGTAPGEDEDPTSGSALLAQAPEGDEVAPKTPAEIAQEIAASTAGVEDLPDGYVPIFADPKFEEHPDVMTALVGEPEPSDEAIELDPMVLMPPDKPISPEARAEVVAMLRAMQPLKLSLTSDHHDRQFILNKKRIEALEQSEQEEIGWAALHAFTNYPGKHFGIRSSLLRVGARVAPKEATTLLKELVFRYDLASLSDRTEALRYLAEIAPADFKEGSRPYLERPALPFQTAPADEFFARGWSIACEQDGESPVPMMAQIAMNLALEPAARHFALQSLAEHGDDPLARATLSEALIESTGNGYFRRRAAQGVLAAFPSEDACSILRTVLEREADVNMARFLDDMVQVNCR